MSYLMLVAGLFILIKGADWLIDGGSTLARRLGVSNLLVGLTVVAFGTSMPEFFVNVLSALSGSTSLAMGNVVGSNLANLLLILGIVALIKPPKIAHSTVWKEIPLSLLAAVALWVMALDVHLDGAAQDILTRSEGLVLLLFMVIFFFYLVSMGLSDRSAADLPESGHKASAGRAVFWVVAGVAGLYLGGRWAVEGAVMIARLAGLSEYLIAVTIVAIGTSLPELVTSVRAALKGNSDLAVGNVVGSNIFNIFWIMGITSLISPVPIPAGAALDLIVLVVASSVLFIFMFVSRRHELERWQGVLFFISYLAYVSYLVVKS